MTDAILRKIKALLALTEARGATEAEAAAAAAAAQRLIEAHDLDVATLDEHADPEPPPEEATDETLDPEDASRQKVRWRGILASAIGRANGCKTYWRGSALRIVGPPSRVAAVRYLYGWLSREVDRLGAEAARGMGRSYGHAFRCGCAERVGRRLVDEAALARSQERDAARLRAGEAGGTALVRLDARLARLDAEQASVARAIARLNLRAAPAARPVQSSGYYAGQRAGDRVRLTAGPALGAGR